IGIGFCTQAASLNNMPGWEDGSWGYHGDDGKKFYGIMDEPYGPKFMTGDIIGCCINFRNSTVFYTRNGMNLGIAFRDLKKALYPCVGMLSPGGSIGANFGYRKFKYMIMNDDDIDESLKENWAELLDPYNYKLISQQIFKFSDLKLSSETEQNVNIILKYRVKFYFLIGEYEKSFADMVILLRNETHNTFVSKYFKEIRLIANLDEFPEETVNVLYILNACEEVT
ncbi:11303_t:CDS:2, partial [Funneliformis caledonium]